MRIGLVVAVEMDSVFAYYGELEKLESPAGFEVFRTERGGNTLYIAHTGIGEIAAAAGVQYLSTKYAVEAIVNFGVVGGLTPEMKRHRICAVDRVVYYRYDCSEFMDLPEGQVIGHDSVYLETDRILTRKALETESELMNAVCCSSDKFVGNAEDKNALHERYGGDICDMESAAIVLSCEINSLPCLLLKAVSDGLEEGAKAFHEELNDAAMKCLVVADRIMEKL